MPHPHSPANNLSLRAHWAACVALSLCSLIAGPASAQQAWKYYTVEHPEQFKINWAQFYLWAEEQTAAVRDELPHRLNIAYGTNAKQGLDLYFPKRRPRHAPVFLFLHGGGFREGDRAQYGFIAGPFAAHGIITAVASYRLTDAGYHYPNQEHDTEAAVKWLVRHIAQYGGDPRELFVGGHSAGAVLSAEVGVDRSWLTRAGIPQCWLRGIAPVSGEYDLRSTGRPGELDVYAPTPELQAQASPLLHIVDPAPAAVVAVGAQEGYLVPASQLFTEKLTAAGVKTRLLILPGADHRAAVRQMADGGSALFQAMLAMIEAASKPANARAQCSSDSAPSANGTR